MAIITQHRCKIAGGGDWFSTDDGDNVSPDVITTGLQPNTTYDHQMRRYDTVLGFASAWSDVGQFTTDAPAPQGLGGELFWQSPSITGDLSVISGTNPDGVPQGGASIVADTGAGGSQAIQLVAASLQYVDWGNQLDYQITGELTIAAWVWSNSSIAGRPSNNQPRMLTKSAWPDQHGYRLQHQQGTFNHAVNGVVSQTADNSVNANAADPNPPTYDAWVLHVVTFSPGNYIRYFKNGVQVAENTTAIPTSIFNSSASLITGQDGELSANHYFDGMIDDQRLFDRILSQAEIDWLYNAGNGRGRLGGPAAPPTSYLIPGPTQASIHTADGATFAILSGTDTTGDHPVAIMGTTGGVGPWVYTVEGPDASLFFVDRNVLKIDAGVITTGTTWDITIRSTDSRGLDVTRQLFGTVQDRNGAGITVIDSTWLAEAGNGGPNGPWYLQTEGATYWLDQPITTQDSAFVVTNGNVTFNTNGHRIVWNDSPPVSPLNSSFEAGTGAAADNWSTDANAARTLGDYYEKTTFDQDYSMVISTSSTFVESDPVQLQGGKWYAIAAAFWYQPGSGSIYAVVYDGASNVGNVTYTGNPYPNYMIFALDEFKPGSSGPYTVRVGATTISNPGYIDYVRLARINYYGISLGPAGYDAESVNPGVTQFGNADNCTIIGNGSPLQQGADSGIQCHGVKTRLALQFDISGLDVSVSGDNTSCITTTQNNSGGGNIHHCYATSTTRALVGSRDDLYAVVSHTAGATANPGDIYCNQVYGGCQNGIRALHARAFQNLVQARSYYTNGFAVQGGKAGCFKNTVLNLGTFGTTGTAFGARGMAPNSPGPCYENHVEFRPRGFNQEYGSDNGGGSLGGEYGIQIENKSSIDSYRNVIIGHADNGLEISCYRIGGGSGSTRNADVYDNEFHAISDGADGSWARCIKYDANNGDENNLVFRDNKYLTNDGFFLGVDAYQTFTRPEIDIETYGPVTTWGPGADQWPFAGAYSTTQGNYIDVKVVDAIGSAEALAYLDDAFAVYRWFSFGRNEARGRHRDLTGAVENYQWNGNVRQAD